MNGTESAFKGLYNKTMTDTETILKFIVDQNLSLFASLQELKAAFLGLYDGKVFAVRNNSRPLEVIKTNNNEITKPNIPCIVVMFFI
jgi:hypothetical protein